MPLVDLVCYLQKMRKLIEVVKWGMFFCSLGLLTCSLFAFRNGDMFGAIVMVTMGAVFIYITP